MKDDQLAEMTNLKVCSIYMHSFIFAQYLDRFPPNCMYAFMLTRTSLGVLHVIFCTFAPELWPFIYAKISFPLNIEKKLTDFHPILYMHSF